MAKKNYKTATIARVKASSQSAKKSAAREAVSGKTADFLARSPKIRSCFLIADPVSDG